MVGEILISTYLYNNEKHELTQVYEASSLMYIFVGFSLLCLFLSSIEVNPFRKDCSYRHIKVPENDQKVLTKMRPIPVKITKESCKGPCFPPHNYKKQQQ